MTFDYRIELCASEQFRYVVFDDSGEEVEAGAGFDDECDCIEAAADACCEWNRSRNGVGVSKF